MAATIAQSVGARLTERGHSDLEANAFRGVRLKIVLPIPFIYSSIQEEQN